MRNGFASTTLGIATIVGLAVGSAACSGSGDDGADPVTIASSPPDSRTVDTESGGATTSSPAPDTTGDSQAAPDESAPLPTTAIIDTVPEDGVPGIESDDRFCQAWSEFGGSFQALTLASHAAADPTTAAAIELAASDVIVQAVATMDANFPDSIDPDDRSLFLDGVLGPFTDRAVEAQQILRSSGLSEAQVAELGDIWLATLIETGLGDPDIGVDVPDELQPSFDNAVEVWTADHGSIATDTDLITDARAPQTDAYLAAECPDQGILSGNDVVGD